MPENAMLSSPEFKAAFLANTREERMNTGKVACALVIVLMPAGVSLDLAMYPEHVRFFLGLRLLCSLLVGVVLYLHTTQFGQRNYKLLGLPIVLLPAGFIALMIHSIHEPASPYYAGLNLIMLAVSVVASLSVEKGRPRICCRMRPASWRAFSSVQPGSAIRNSSSPQRPIRS